MSIPTLMFLIVVFVITTLLICRRVPKIKEFSLGIVFFILIILVFFIGRIVGSVGELNKGYGVNSQLMDLITYIHSYHREKGVYPAEKNFNQWKSKRYPNWLIRYSLEKKKDGRQSYTVGYWTGDGMHYYSSSKGFYYDGI